MKENPSLAECLLSVSLPSLLNHHCPQEGPSWPIMVYWASEGRLSCTYLGVSDPFLFPPLVFGLHPRPQLHYPLDHLPFLPLVGAQGVMPTLSCSPGTFTTPQKLFL